MHHLMTVLRGAAIGLADVVPGVSGGTVALILGIYVKFIQALRSLNVGWIPGFFRWAKAGFSAEARGHFLEPIQRIHWSFLVPLGVGILSAIVVGSRVIPPLMMDQPVAMFSLFFGLILASIALPIREMRRRGPLELLFVLLFAGLAWTFVGTSAQPVMTPQTFTEPEPMNLEAFTRAHPSVFTPEELYCPREGAANNVELREALLSSPDTRALAERLDNICASLAAARSDLALYQQIRTQEALGRKDPGNPFHEVVVPAGVPVHIPRPAHWFMFLAGFVAICAMVLPGISGSFLLLVFGVYYFLLTSLKGSIDSLIVLSPNVDAISYAGAFAIGALLGLVSFARLMSWLFQRFGSLTLAAMVGLMIGCLRAIWPYKIGDPGSGAVINVGPADGAELVTGLVAFSIGFGLVAALTIWEIRKARVSAAAVTSREGT